MKKLFFFFSMLVLAVTSVSAQSFTNVQAVSKQKKAFFAQLADGSVQQISLQDYYLLKDNPQNFCVASYETDAPNKSFQVIVNKNQYLDEMLQIDSLGLAENNMIEVYFTNNQMFKSANKEWLSAKKGQNVRHTKIIDKRNFERYQAITADMAVGHVSNVPNWDKKDVVVQQEEKQESKETLVASATPAPLPAPLPVPVATQQQVKTMTLVSSTQNPNKKGRTIALPNGLVLTEN